MNTIMVNTTLGKVENIEEVLRGEFAVVAEWQQKGILAHIFVKEAGGGAVLVFNETNFETVKHQLLQNAPSCLAGLKGLQMVWV